MELPPKSTATELHDREGITLSELKKQLNFVPPSSTAPLTEEESAKLEQCIDAFLARFLQSKYLSVAEAASKLHRRRVFESALPAITVTPSVVACLRSGALRIIGHDLEQRLVLFFDARQLPSWPTLSKEDTERFIVLVLLYMEHRCMQCTYETPMAGRATVKTQIVSSYRSRQQMLVLINAQDLPVSRFHGSLLRYMTALQPIASKYFPHLVDLVLVVGASYGTRRAIQSALTHSPPAYQRAVEMVQEKDLSRFMDRAVIPSSLGGGNQGADQQLGGVDGCGAWAGAVPNVDAVADEEMTSVAVMNTVPGMTSTIFAEAVMRHWYLVTAFLTMESNLQRNQPNCPQRPLYLPPPLQFMPPTTSLSVMMKDQPRSRGSNAGLSTSTGSSSGAMHAVFPYFMAVPATVPILTGLPQSCRGVDRDSVVFEKEVRERDAHDTSLMGTAIKGSYTNRPHSSTLRRRHNVPRSATSAGRAGGPDASPVPDPPGQADVEPTTVDDGLCSSLVSSTFVDTDDLEELDEDDRVSVENEEDAPGPHSWGKGAGHATASRTSAKVAPANATAAHGAFGTAGADVDPAEEEKIRTDPVYALRTVRQERGRRLIAEQRVQLAQLGLTMDPQNASLVERELAGIHEELNVLVSEVLVRSREAAGPKNRPSLTQLLDVTVSVLEASVQDAERVPAVSAFALPVQRDEDLVDNAVGGGCCCAAM